MIVQSTDTDPIERSMMLRALALARRGSGYVSPNPMVGAVVQNDGKIVGIGWHRRYGYAHAEAEAISMAGERARGGTLFVTLEPCNHYGRTPPCCALILESGIRRVVVAMRDPNPHVRGGGLSAIQAAGISVEVGLLEDRARELNTPWLHWLNTSRPFVVLKFAVSLDGKINDPNSPERWISSATSRAQVHRLRRHVDAILVGAETVLHDNPALTNRTGIGRQPLRVVVDSELRVGSAALVYRPLPSDQEGRNPIAVCFTTTKAPYSTRRLLELAGVEVIVLEGADGRVDLDAACGVLGRMGVQSMLCEGGAQLGTTMLDRGLAHRLLLYQAPRTVGRDGLDFYQGGDRAMGLRLRLLSTKKIGRDSLLEYVNENSELHLSDSRSSNRTMARTKPLSNGHSPQVPEAACFPE
jgi:diaminohydroxyphosphoribosylaminopyrimidine deaminase/5-amino-6-(5-phosphoribosylamino)uracil reductase